MAAIGHNRQRFFGNDCQSFQLKHWDNGRKRSNTAKLVVIRNSTRSFFPGFQRKPGKKDRDRKSTRLNSSHVRISYAVFCLKKKKLDRHPDFLLALDLCEVRSLAA